MQDFLNINDHFILMISASELIFLSQQQVMHLPHLIKHLLPSLFHPQYIRAWAVETELR